MSDVGYRMSDVGVVTGHACRVAAGNIHTNLLSLQDTPRLSAANQMIYLLQKQQADGRDIESGLTSQFWSLTNR